MDARRLVTMLIIFFAAGLWAGCRQQARLDVHQPHVSSAQQRLHLASSWALFANNDAARVLLAFPLPGAQRGAKHYYVYLRCPAIPYHSTQQDDASGDVGGFFQQVKGRYAGITEFDHVTIHVDGGDEVCSGRFQIVCDDGTELNGDFVAQRDDQRVRQFEETFGID